MGGRGAKGRARVHERVGDAEPITPPPPPAADPPPTEQAQTEPPVDPPTPAPSGGLETRIAQAWQQLAQEPQDWIRMARVRALLGNPDDAELRQTLLTMMRTGLVHLAPDSNRKVLTDADHAAAIPIGGEPKHLLAFEPEYFDQQQGGTP